LDGSGFGTRSDKSRSTLSRSRGFQAISCSLGGLPELCLVWMLRIRIVRTAPLPKGRETSIANAVVLQREYCDYITQGPPILLGLVAGKNAFVLRDRLHCRSVSIDA
jgi:hypothetical protein